MAGLGGLKLQKWGEIGFEPTNMGFTVTNGS
jgi:hypothetical protein